MRRFRQERRKALRERWKEHALLAGFILAALAWVLLADGFSKVLGAFVLGVAVATAMYGWLMGFDARLLRWRWGAAGEEWTAEELKRLGREWRVIHDLADGSSNLDHVVVGPGGVYLVDSKNVSQTARADDAGLTAGRVRYSAVVARGAAVRLKEMIQQETGLSVWVQSVFAIWGDFPAGIDERDRVLYVSADRLTEALTARRRQLSETQVARVADAIESRLSSAG